MGASTSFPLAATLERPTGAIATAIDESLAAGSDLDAQQLLDALASGSRAGLLRLLLATPNSASSPAESADGTPTLLNKIADILWEGARERLVAHIRAKASNTLSEEFAMSLADALAERGLAKAVLSGGAEGTSYGPASRSKRLSIALSSGHVTDALQSTALEAAAAAEEAAAEVVAAAQKKAEEAAAAAAAEIAEAPSAAKPPPLPPSTSGPQPIIARYDALLMSLIENTEAAEAAIVEERKRLELEARRKQEKEEAAALAKSKASQAARAKPFGAAASVVPPVDVGAIHANNRRMDLAYHERMQQQNAQAQHSQQAQQQSGGGGGLAGAFAFFAPSAAQPTTTHSKVAIPAAFNGGADKQQAASEGGTSSWFGQTPAAAAAVSVPKLPVNRFLTSGTSGDPGNLSSRLKTPSSARRMFNSLSQRTPSSTTAAKPGDVQLGSAIAANGGRSTSLSHRSARHEHFILTSPQPKAVMPSPKPQQVAVSSSATYFGGGFAPPRAGPIGTGFKPAGPRGNGYTLRDAIYA